MSRRGKRDQSTAQTIYVLGVCEIIGKYKYPDKKTAKLARQSMLARGLDATDLRPYRCMHCDTIHLGSSRVHGVSTSREHHRAIQEHRTPFSDP